jgi:modulator of FtsH protease
MNPELNDWAPFFAAQVGASAALVGLVAVAISINLTRILSFPRLPSRAAECLVILTSALVVSSLALMPGRQIAVFGGEAFALGLACTGVSLANLIRQVWRPREISLFKIVSAASASFLSTLSLVIGGALIVSGDNSGLDWVGASVVISLAVGVMNSWVLLVEILR